MLQNQPDLLEPDMMFGDNGAVSEGPPPIPPWEIRTLAHAYKQRAPTQWVVDQFFARETLNIVYGAPASMKSMLMADLCACVVAGTDWLPGLYGGGQGIKTTQAPVFWLDMDNGTRRTDERIDAVAKAKRLPIDAPFYYLSMPVPPYNAFDLEPNLMLIDTIRAADAQLVVIDNLGLITGEVEENSAQMAQVMGYLRIVAERTRAALLVIHHQRKGGANGSRAGEAVRGHSSIEAAVDLALQITRERDTSEVSIRSTKTRGVDVPQVRGLFNFTHVDNTYDLATAWFSGATPVHGDNPIRDTILDVLEDTGPIAKTRLTHVVHDALGGEYGINKIRAWIDDMVNVSGAIKAQKGKDNASILMLP